MPDIDIFDEEIPEVIDTDELPVPEADGPDIFDEEIPDVVDDLPSADAPEPSLSDRYVNSQVGLADGITMGHGRELGGVGDSLMNMLMDRLHPYPEGTTISGPRGTSDQLSDRAEQSIEGRIAKPVGQAGMTALATAATGGAVLPAMGVGALGGAASAHGDGGGLGEMAGGALGGAAGGLMGGLAGKALGAVGGAVNAPSREGVAQAWAPIATRGEEALLALAKSKPTLDKWFTEPVKSLGNWAGRKALPLGAKVGEYATSVSGAITGAVAPGAARVGTAIAPGKAKAQVAYAGEPTMSWAVQSVLTQGNTGLPPADEQRLTEAVMSGDPSKVIAANFQLQQKHPGYAKRYQDEVTSLQDDQ